MKNKRRLYNLVFLLLFQTIHSQITEHVDIHWHIPGPSVEMRAADMKPFNPAHSDWDGENLYYVLRFNGRNFDQHFTVENIEYSPVSGNFAKAFVPLRPPSDFRGKLFSLHGRNAVVSVFRINTLIYRNNRWYKLDAFDVRLYPSEQRQLRRAPLPVEHSPLSRGKWYRFEVDKTGIYRIDKNFLNSLGINTGNLDPRHIHIFGWGGRMLPLSNASPLPQSLAEIPVEIHGETDGRFDDGDYILFFGTGKHTWNGEYHTYNNIYTDKAYYYIQIDDTQNGKRIPEYQQPPGTPVWTTDVYLAERFYEEDSVNVAKLGREWYGNNFNYGQAKKSFDFRFDNFLPAHKVIYSMKAATDNPLTGQIRIKMNGQEGRALTMYALTPAMKANGILATGNAVTDSISVSSGDIHVELQYDDGGYPPAKIFLDYLRIMAYCRLDVNGKSFVFSNPFQATYDTTDVVAYELHGAASLREVWDVTNPFEVKKITAGGQANFHFKTTGGKRRYITVTDQFLSPSKPANTKVDNLDLRWDTFHFDQSGLGPEYLVIAPEAFRAQAERLVQFHSGRGLRAYFAPLEDIYAGFGNGTQDVAAIRNYIRYIYLHQNPAERIKYVTLLGDASWDFKNIQVRAEDNTNVVPVFQSRQSFSLVTSFATDDFFVAMDDNEGNIDTNVYLPDIAVGRIPAATAEQADHIIDKMLHYYDPSTFGPWHNNVTLLSDDADSPSHSWELGLINSTMQIARRIETYHPFINLHKIYLDAYREVSTAGGYRYPDAKRDLLNDFEKGMLILNFIGHGNEYGWTHERVMNIPEIKSLRNYDKLPFVSTVTCEFGRFDNPKTVSGAELFVLNRFGGAFQIVTTTREISAAAGMYFNIKLYKYLFGTEQSTFTHFRTPGVALLMAKQQYGSLIKKVSLLGDPAMPLHFAGPEIVITNINAQSGDTIRALDRVHIEGEIRDTANQLVTGYNGTIHPVIFDKKETARTLNNDDVPGQDITFTRLGPALFRGSARVNGGRFAFDFVVPKDIRPDYGHGKISLYAFEDQDLRKGVDTTVVIGGINTQAPDDNKPPVIRLYMNDYNFSDGGVVNPDPFLLVKLEDENGINTVGGVGHDITAVLDGDVNNPFVLNDYYEADANTYTRGKIKFKLFGLSPGLHTIKVKAWDTYNNPAEASISFRVVASEKLEVTRVLNYPNPFIDYTEFWFTTNHPYENLDVQIDVFSASGELVWQHRQNILTQGSVSRDITWNGRDMFGRKIGKGVYFYRVTVRTEDGKHVTKWQKLVKL